MLSILNLGNGGTDLKMFCKMIIIILFLPNKTCWINCRTTLGIEYWNSFVKHSTSVTRLGDFLKFLLSNYISKVAQMFVDIWSILKHKFQVKLPWLLFWATFEKMGYFLIHYLVTLDSTEKMAEALINKFSFQEKEKGSY